jgi:hypothetical protein
MVRRRKPSCRRIAATALILGTLSLALPTSAVSATRTYSAVNVHCGIATFKLVGLKSATVRAARVTLGQRDARVKSAVVRRAARRGTLRLRLSTLRWTSLRARTHKRRTATRRRAERHAKRARREKHTGCRGTRAQQAQVRRRKRPKLTVIISDPPNSTDPTPDPPTSTDPVAPPSAGEPGPIAGMGYRQTFRDDFDMLNRGVWDDHIWYDGAPSSVWGNFQYAQNGILHLATSRNYGYALNTVTTQSSGKTFQYGYFEARMMWSGGHGAWPGFWLYSYRHATNPAWPSVNPICSQLGEPASHCYAGELDAFEGQGSEPQAFYGTIHRNSCGCYGVGDQQNGNNWQAGGVDLTAGFHSYGMLWTSTQVSWYLDGRLMMSATPYDSLNQPMFLLLQMWTGGWTYDPDATTPSTIETQVDYVQVWQK